VTWDTPNLIDSSSNPGHFGPDLASSSLFRQPIA
jgi:hypothetical protein